MTSSAGRWNGSRNCVRWSDTFAKLHWIAPQIFKIHFLWKEDLFKKNLLHIFYLPFNKQPPHVRLYHSLLPTLYVHRKISYAEFLLKMYTTKCPAVSSF